MPLVTTKRWRFAFRRKRTKHQQEQEQGTQEHTSSKSAGQSPATCSSRGGGVNVSKLYSGQSPCVEEDSTDRQLSSSSLLPETGDPLLDRLGGELVLLQIVHDFCYKSTHDSRLASFFARVDPKVLAAHQHHFFRMALATPMITPDQHCILARYLGDKHKHLFKTHGINTYHFDWMVQHLMDVLEDMEYSQAIMDDVAAIIVPLRTAFNPRRMGVKSANSDVSILRNQTV